MRSFLASMFGGMILFLSMLSLAQGATVSSGDYNGDGKVDVLWRHTTSGKVFVWLMDGTAILGTGSPATVGDRNWQIWAVGDVNGDGKADLIWRHATSGEVFVWLMDGTAILGTGSPGAFEDRNWQIQGVGDVDMDGKADFIWRHATSGQVVVWLMNGTAILGAGIPATVADHNWQIRAVGDVNGDEKADLIWRHATSGQVFVWLMDGTTILGMGSPATVADRNWQIRGGVGDVNMDEKADLIWRHATSGKVFVWLMDGTAILGTGSPATVADGDWQIQPVARLRPPIIITQPAKLTVAAPAAAKFSVQAIGDPPLTYQWQRNGKAIPGATGATYILKSTNIAKDNGAKFSVVVSNAAGRVTSATVTLTVLPYVDISGTWNASETINAHCTWDGESEEIEESGTGLISIIQNNQQVRYTPPQFSPEFNRTGTVTGDKVEFRGLFIRLFDVPVSWRKNEVIAKGPITGNPGTRIDLIGAGEAIGTVVNIGEIRCTGTSTVIATR